ncbi:MAG: hypothetical protein WBG42_06170 [Cryomorphaceae bacterium]
MMKLFLSALCLFTLSIPSFSQFEGVVVYDVNYEAIDESKRELLAMLPKKSHLYIKGEQSLFEQTVAGGGKQSFYIDAGKGSGTLVMQFLGQAYKVDMTQEEIESLKKAKKLEITMTDNRETVVGYSCDAAIAISESDTLNILFSTDLVTTSRVPPFAEVDGIPLKYEMVRGGVKMTYTATEVKEKRLEESTFDSNSDIKSMEFSDFAKSFAIVQ